MYKKMRLICPVTGAFLGLVRLKQQRGTFCTVWAETPILDYLSVDERGRYPGIMPYEIGHVFNCETSELSPLLNEPQASSAAQRGEEMGASDA